MQLRVPSAPPLQVPGLPRLRRVLWCRLGWPAVQSTRGWRQVPRKLRLLVRNLSAEKGPSLVQRLFPRPIWSRELPWKLMEGPSRAPEEALGLGVGPWAGQGTSICCSGTGGALPEMTWGALEGLWGALRSPWGSPGELPGWPWGDQEAKTEDLRGPRGALMGPRGVLGGIWASSGLCGWPSEAARGVRGASWMLLRRPWGVLWAEKNPSF